MPRYEPGLLLLTDEFLIALRKAIDVHPRSSIFDLIKSPERIFYCSTCDSMVKILPAQNFRTPPAWRSDVFRWRR